MNTLTLVRPDDWHVHLRDGAQLAAVLPDTARRFARAVVMPNLVPPVTTIARALEYRARILAALPAGTRFEPLMTLYLTEDMRPEEVRIARASGVVHAVKYYPAGATTHSEAGVSDLTRCYRVLEALEQAGMPLLVHGEVADPEADPFDRERLFLERVAAPLIERFAGLRIVLEHISTREAADFVARAPARVAATITAHHLLVDRGALFAGGIRPHHFCRPLLQRAQDREALVQAATSGSPKFFLGTDSAPHPRVRKESGCGCAGVYTAHAALELYAEVFAAAGALERLEGFASWHGPRFYGLPPNSETVTLVQQPWRVPEELAFGAERLVPFRAGEQVAWKLV